MANIPSSNYSNDVEQQDNPLEKNQQLQQLFFRILPYWHIMFLALVLGIAVGYLFLRYATPIYQVKARILINDDSQQKSANLQEIIKLDTRNLTYETEREVEVLRSTDMLRKVASQLQLNVMYGQQGNIKTGAAYNNIPFKVELQDPDSVDRAMGGEVKIVGNQINFAGVLYPVDTFVPSPSGSNLRWHIYKNFSNVAAPLKWTVNIQTVSTAARMIKGSISVAPISKGSFILDIGYIDPFPARGVQVLNTLFAVYTRSSVDYKSRIYENTQKFLDGRLGLISDELTGVEKRLQAYKTSEHIIDLSQEGSLYLNKLRQADTRISELDVQMEVLTQIEKYVNKRNNSTDPVPATLGISDPTLTSLLNQLYQAEFELEKLRQLSGEKNPQIEVSEQLIARLKPSINASINNLKLNLETTKRQLQGDNAAITSSINKMPEKERALLDISRQQAIKNAIYTFLLQKKEESAIAAASVVPNVRVIERPEFGTVISPNRQNYFTIAILVSLLLAAAIIYLKEFANRRLLFRSQIESRLPAIPIIGELVFKPDAAGAPVVGEGKRTLIAEQFRELRTNINFAAAADGNISGTKTILVTSSIPGEGKSFIAINTSISLCLTGSRVVLLEFDLRKPKISKALGIHRTPGISNYLVGTAAVTDIIQNHPTVANFHIIASGPVPPNPAELIGSPKLVELMTYLKANFDYIILDSPPVASVTDAKLLGAFADVTLYVIRHNFTDNDFLKLINELYQKKSIPNLNIVFNGITSKRIPGYGYGKGYGYGYAYTYGYGYTEEEIKATGWRKFINRLSGKK